MGREIENEAAANLVRVMPPDLPLGKASSEQLRERLWSIIGIESQIAAVRAQALAELHRRDSLSAGGLPPSRTVSQSSVTALEHTGWHG